MSTETAGLEGELLRALQGPELARIAKLGIYHSSGNHSSDDASARALQGGRCTLDAAPGSERVIDEEHSATTDIDADLIAVID